MPKKRPLKAKCKPRPFDDDWLELLSFRDFLPRQEFPFVLRRVSGHLYRFAEQGYVCLGTLTHVQDDFPRNCLRILKLFWARNDDAALVAAHLHCRVGSDGRRHFRKINRQKLQRGTSVPPSELLGGMSINWSNGDTYRAARRLKRPVPECASYDGSGQFTYKTVSIPRLQILYASRPKNENELPMAVEILPNRRVS